jgi:hypothetical protein
MLPLSTKYIQKERKKDNIKRYKIKNREMIKGKKLSRERE